PTRTRRRTRATRSPRPRRRRRSTSRRRTSSGRRRSSSSSTRASTAASRAGPTRTGPPSPSPTSTASEPSGGDMRATSCIAALLLTAGAARAQESGDFLVLKDGRVIEGKKLSRADGGVQLHFDNGEVFVPQELVQDCLIAGEALAPATEEEQAQIAKGN